MFIATLKRQEFKGHFESQHSKVFGKYLIAGYSSLAAVSVSTRQDMHIGWATLINTDEVQFSVDQLF
jgi:hypothetical protein